MKQLNHKTDFCIVGGGGGRGVCGMIGESTVRLVKARVELVLYRVREDPEILLPEVKTSCV